MKKITSCILVIAILCGCFSGLQITSSALSNSGICGENAYYTFDSSTGLLMINGSGTIGSYYEMTYSNGVWSDNDFICPFIGNKNITTVIIDDGIIEIGDSAFKDCSNLTSIIIPESVTNIVSDAFNGCNNLKTVGPIESDCDIRFCWKTMIPSNIFANCISLIDVIIPNSIMSIGDKAFPKTIKSVSLPVDMKIDFACFNNCTNLQIINLKPGESGNMTDWSSDYADSLWYLHKDTIREINLEEGITNISESAFYGCNNLIKTNVPSTVTSIGRYAYYGCSNLRNITILSPNCIIPLNENTIDSFATIYGHENSTAQEYAQKYDRDFVSLGDSVCTHVPAAAVRENEVAATCTQQGFYDEVIYCSLCGEELSKEHKQSERLEHNYGSAVTEPTCTHAGYTTYTCADCGYSYIDDFVPMTEHDYVDTVTEPTTEAQGYTVHTCKDCGYSYVDSITDILPSQMHYVIPSLADINTTLTIKSDENEYSVTAENGIFELDNIKGDVYRVYVKQKNSLAVCIGAYDTKSGEVTCQDDVIIPLGDVNGDDVIDIADLSALLATGNYGKPNNEIDLTGDGMINIYDIAVALQATNYGKSSVIIAQ